MKMSFIKIKISIFKNYKAVDSWRRIKIGKLKKWLTKRPTHFIKSTLRWFVSLFFEKIYYMWLLRKWVSVMGYIIVFSTFLILIIIADKFDSTRPFIHMENANEAIIGAFTMLLALLIPLAIVLIQGDADNSFVRQTMTKTIIRFGKMSFVLLLICIGLFIPENVYITGESLTLKNLYAPVLVVCITFIFTSFYRSIRWLGDESAYSSGASGDKPPKNPNDGGFSSYRFAWIVRLLNGTKSFQTWMAIWSQWFPVGYEETIHQAFFDHVYAVVKNKKRKQYRALSLELDAYDKNFDKRNQYSYRFEYENPERFFTLHKKIEQILEEKYVSSRMDGLWQGKEATKNISIKYIDALMTQQRVWSLFESMSRYLKSNDLIEIRNNKVREDELLKHFLTSVFDSIKADSISAHDASEHFRKPDSAWTVTYDHIYNNKKRYNLSVLVQTIYWDWLRTTLDKLNDTDYILENDSIVEMVFPETDPITMGKLYWLLYLGGSSDHLNQWVKRHRPIGLMNFGPGFYEATTTKEEESKVFYEHTNVQEYNSIKLFCSLYWPYLRTDFLDLSKNLETAKSMERSNLSKTESVRLDDFIVLAESILKFYEDKDGSDNSKKSTKTKF